MKIKDQLAKLIDVKTIVTFAVTGIFAVLSLRGVLDPAVVMGTISMIYTFYFTTQQMRKKEDKET